MEVRSAANLIAIVYMGHGDWRIVCRQRTIAPTARLPPSSTVDAIYDAFISYSHGADGKLGPALRDALHRFARPWNARRALRVFCDQRSLSPSAGLWNSIRSALDQSEWFILLAGPESAKSEWVIREVGHWLATRPIDRIIIVHTGGRLAWDDRTGDFDWDRTTALPAVLKGRFPGEPLHVPLDPGTPHGLAAPEFRDAVAAIAATVHGKSKDDLIGIDIDEHRKLGRFRKATMSALTALTALAVAAAAMAFVQLGVANEQRRETERQRQEVVAQQRLAVARLMLSQSEIVAGTDPRLAMRLALAAGAINPGVAADAARIRIMGGSHIQSSFEASVGILAASVFRPDGKVLVTADTEEMKAWDVSDRGRPLLLSVRGIDTKMSTQPRMWFSPDGTRLVVAGISFAEAWDFTDPSQPQRKFSQTLPDPDLPPDIFRNDLPAISPDGRFLACIRQNGSVILYLLTDSGAEQVATLGADTDGDLVGAVTFAPDGRALVTVDLLGRVDLWDIGQPAQPVLRMSVQHDDLAYASLVEMPPSAQPYALVAADSLHVVDLSGSGAVTPIAPTDTGVIASSADGKLLATAETSGIRLWRFDNGGLTALTTITGHLDSVDALAFSPDGNDLAAGAWDGSMIIASVRAPVEFPVERELASGDQFRRIAASRDSEVYAVSDESGATAIWHGTQRSSVVPGGDSVPAVSLDDSGNTLATRDELGVILWDLSGPGQPERLAGPFAESWLGRYPLALSLSPTGRLLFAPDYLETNLWDVSTPRSPASLTSAFNGTEGFDVVAFTADDERAVTSGVALETWDISDPGRTKILATAKHSPRVPYDIVLSGDARLAVHAESTAITIWDLGDFRRPAQIGGPLPWAGAHALSLSIDGRTLIAANYQVGVSVWDLTDPGRPYLLSHLSGPEGGIDAQFGAADRHILLATEDHVSVLSTRPLETLRARAANDACAFAGHGLTANEWAAYATGIAFEPTC